MSLESTHCSGLSVLGALWPWAQFELQVTGDGADVGARVLPSIDFATPDWHSPKTSLGRGKLEKREEEATPSSALQAAVLGGGAGVSFPFRLWLWAWETPRVL